MDLARLSIWISLAWCITLVACGRAPARPVKRNPAKMRTADPTWKQAASEARTISPRKWTQDQLSEFVLHEGGEDQKIVALTFDDGPHASSTQDILAILRQENVRATFFVVGFMAKKRPDLVRAAFREGHEIGNHSFSHASLPKVPYSKIITDYLAASNVIRELTGSNPRYCRPPGGDSSPVVLEAAADLGMTSVFWTNNPGDTNRLGDHEVFRRSVNRLTPGGIILLHDGPKDTLRALVRLIRTAKMAGYRFVSLDELKNSGAIAKSAKKREATMSW